MHQMMLTWCEVEGLVRGRIKMKIKSKGDGNSKADRGNMVDDLAEGD